MNLRRSGCLGGLLALLLVIPDAGAMPDGFAELARRIPGFRLVLNRPPVPETPFFTASHEPRRLSEFGGRVVLVTFWATWCKPCGREMPELDALQRALADEDFIVLPIAAGQQMGKTPEDFLAEKQLNALSVYRDPHARLLESFETRRVPASFLVDRDGRVLGGVIGATRWDTPEAVAAIRALLD